MTVKHVLNSIQLNTQPEKHQRQFGEAPGTSVSVASPSPLRVESPAIDLPSLSRITDSGSTSNNTGLTRNRKQLNLFSTLPTLQFTSVCKAVVRIFCESQVECEGVRPVIPVMNSTALRGVLLSGRFGPASHGFPNRRHGAVNNGSQQWDTKIPGAGPRWDALPSTVRRLWCGNLSTVCGNHLRCPMNRPCIDGICNALRHTRPWSLHLHQRARLSENKACVVSPDRGFGSFAMN